MAGIESQELKKKAVMGAKTQSPLWRIVSLVALAIAVIAASMVIVGAENNLRVRKEISVQNDSMKKLQATQQQLDAQLIQQQLALQSAVANLEQLRSSTHNDPVSPVLAEVDYLVRLANYNAQYIGDSKIVLALLETAEQRVSALSSSQLADVRGALVANITTLKGVKAVDFEGILLRLNALSDAVVTLPIVRESKLVEATKPNETSTTMKADNTWKEKLMACLSEIKKVVVVQHLSEPVVPLMAADQHTNLVGNIQLKLALAQWAVLHREPKIYSGALAQAKDWIGRYFTANEMTNAVITGLSELDKMDIKPSLPDLADTVALVDQAMQEHQQQVAKSSGVSGPTASSAPQPESTPVTAGASATPKVGSSTVAPSAGAAAPGAANTPASASPAPAAPLKSKPQNPAEPEVISS